MNQLKSITKGITMGLINNFLTIILPFISRTIIIRQLGTEYVGLGSLFTSVLQILSLSELGFGSAVSYVLYKPIARHDINKVNAILGFYKKIYRIIGFIILGISLIMLPFLDYLIADGIPNKINIYVLYIIYIVNTVISYFLFAYKKILFSVNQRYDLEISISATVLVAQYVLQVVLLLIFKDYYIYSLVIPLMTILNNIISNIIINNIFPGYYCEGTLKKIEIREILKNTGGAFASKIGSTVYLSVDNIIISAFLGLIILGRYNNYYYVISSLITVFAVIHNSIRPIIGNMAVMRNKNDLWEKFKFLNSGYIYLVNFCCICCFVLYQDFEYVWCGAEELLEFDIVILLVCYFFSGRLTGIIVVFLEATGVLWQGKFIPLFSAMANLTLNLFLVNSIGLKGVLISSVISSLFISLPGYIYVFFKYLFINNPGKNFLIKFLINTTVKLVISLLFCKFVLDYIIVTGWGGLIYKAVLTVLLSNIVLVILDFNNPGLKKVFTLLKNVIQRRL